MLILAATPIGNLEDVTPRLRRVLAEATTVYAEDTRRSRKLLTHFGLDTPLEAFHEHSPPDVLARIEARLAAGETLVYLSDAGTPCISDPGFELVNAAHRLGVPVDAAPGPCAVINALVLAGLPNHEFCFLGFFPAKQEKKLAMLARLQALAMTAVFFESPVRIPHTLDLLCQHLPETEIALCREMTKMHQQILRGKPTEVRAALSQTKGEFVLVVAPVNRLTAKPPLLERHQALIRAGHSPTQIAKTLAREYGLSKREVYRQIQAATRS